MLTALWDLSAAICGYLGFYMPPPSRRLAPQPAWPQVGHPRRNRATPTYLGLTALSAEGAARPSCGWLNVLVSVFFWNAMKFVWMPVLSPLLLVKLRAGRVRARRMLQTNALGWSTRFAQRETDSSGLL